MIRTSTPNPNYPARCLPPEPTGGVAPAPGDTVLVYGRLLCGDARGGLLLGPDGVKFQCRWAWVGQPPAGGAILEVEGRAEKGGVWATRVRVLAPALARPRVGEWGEWEEEQARMRRVLALRAQVFAAVRAHFAAAGFLEVETPGMVPAPGQEANLLLFETRYRARQPVDLCLVSSPEHHMKRLLGAGFARIYQLGRAFRNGERSATHLPEFTMLEWYRAYASYEEIMVDVEALVAGVSLAVRGTTVFEYQGQALDLTPPWRRLSVREAFAEFAGIDLDPEVSLNVFRRLATKCSASVDTKDSWEEIFFKLLLEKIEPGMAATGRPVLLRDYPASMAALAKIRPGDGVAERVEAYAGGMELANGFTELNDPEEQRRRFAAERAKRAALGFPLHPIDEEFLEMLRLGMPPAGGMALGMDRLVMLLADARCIDEVVAFPFPVVEALV